MLKFQSTLDEIQKQIAKNPSAIAIRHGKNIYSYRDLDLYSNRLANYLKHYHISEGDIVAFFMRRSFEALITILGIWKAKATYLSLDVDTPLIRLSQIIQQAEPKCMVTEPALLSLLPFSFPILTLQDPEYIKCDVDYPSRINQRDQPAYLIYTSGSTGLPKGVLVTHGNFANYVSWFNEHFQIAEQDIFDFNSSLAFDFSLTCTLTPLARGAQVHITSETEILDIELYCQQLIFHQVTFVKWTPSYFKLLINYIEKYQPDFSSLRYIMIAGEELLTIYLEKWFAIYPEHIFINEYGPTETTVGITTQLITKQNLNKQFKTVPIGSGIQNTLLYVVDSDNRLVKEGDIGELVIGGLSVSLGYYKEPALTQTRFIKNPFNNGNDILYKTGDLVRQLPDQSYLYVGRLDNQVKVNGFRVEINEIEHCLLKHPAIDQTCILPYKEKGNQFLVGYIVIKDQEQFNEAEIRCYLSEYLPQFMIPRRFITIENLPLTLNGKIDHKKLLTLADAS